jgi:hypothetical protein
MREHMLLHSHKPLLSSEQMFYFLCVQGQSLAPCLLRGGAVTLIAWHVFLDYYFPPLRAAHTVHLVLWPETTDIFYFVEHLCLT